MKLVLALFFLAFAEIAISKGGIVSSRPSISVRSTSFSRPSTPIRPMQIPRPSVAPKPVQPAPVYISKPSPKPQTYVPPVRERTVYRDRPVYVQQPSSNGMLTGALLGAGATYLLTRNNTSEAADYREDQRPTSPCRDGYERRRYEGHGVCVRSY